MTKNTIILAILSVVLFSCKEEASKQIKEETKDDIKGIGVFTLGSHKSQYSHLIEAVEPYIVYDNVQSYQQYSIDYKFNDSLDLVEVELSFYNDTLFYISTRRSLNADISNRHESHEDIYNILKLKYPHYMELKESESSIWECRNTSYTMSGNKNFINLYNSVTFRRVDDASKYIPIEKMKGL
jgi:hypothetical protein